MYLKRKSIIKQCLFCYARWGYFHTRDLLYILVFVLELLSAASMGCFCVNMYKLNCHGPAGGPVQSGPRSHSLGWVTFLQFGLSWTINTCNKPRSESWWLFTPVSTHTYLCVLVRFVQHLQISWSAVTTINWYFGSPVKLAKRSRLCENLTSHLNVCVWCLYLWCCIVGRWPAGNWAVQPQHWSVFACCWLIDFE